MPAEQLDRLAGHRAVRACALAICAARLAACGNDAGASLELSPVKLLHSPPIGQLAPDQLRALSMDCEQYPQNSSMRGRYDAAYCDEAMAAWADSPLQMVTVPVEPPH